MAGIDRFQSLLPAEHALLDALQCGESCDLDALGIADRTIRSEFLGRILVDADGDLPVTLRRIDLSGATVDGLLDLPGAVIPRICVFRACTFEEINLSDARTLGLFWRACTVVTLNLHGVKVAGDILFGTGFRAAGEVHLVGAEIGGRLSCQGATFGYANGSALIADGAKVAGDVLFSRGFRAAGVVRLAGAQIGGQVICSGGSFECATGDALVANGAKVTGGVFLNGGFRAAGAVHLAGIEIGGQLNCGGGMLEYAEWDALLADGAKVSGGVFLDAGFRTAGTVRLLGTEIGGPLVCGGGTFGYTNGIALWADGARVSDAVLLDAGFRAAGTVRLIGVEIGGQLICSGGAFEYTEGQALSLDGVKVNHDVLLDAGFRAAGTVRLHNAEIGGRLLCSGGTFEYADGHSFSLDGAKVAGDMFLDAGFRTTGSVRLSGAAIGGQINCRGGVFADLVLTDFRTRVLADDRTSWPAHGHLRIEGFEYESIHHESPLGATDRLDWLSRMAPAGDGGVHTQPYEQLAKVYRSIGRERDARTILIAKQRAIRRITPRRSPSRCVSWLLDVTVGYGWRPHLALLWGITVVFASSFVFASAHSHGVFVEQSLVEVAPAFVPPLYALDTFLPIVSLGQEASWQPDASINWRFFGIGGWWQGWVIQAWVSIHILLGWLISTLALAAFTGIIRRE